MLKTPIGQRLALASAVSAILASGVACHQWASNAETGAAAALVAREHAIQVGISRAQLALSRIEAGYRSVDLARTRPEADAALATIAHEAAVAAATLEPPIALAARPEALQESRGHLLTLAAEIAEYGQTARGDLYGRKVDPAATAAARTAVAEASARAGRTVSAALGSATRLTEGAIETVQVQVTQARQIGLIAAGMLALSLLVSSVLLALGLRRPGPAPGKISAAADRIPDERRDRTRQAGTGADLPGSPRTKTGGFGRMLVGVRALVPGRLGWSGLRRLAGGGSTIAGVRRTRAGTTAGPARGLTGRTAAERPGQAGTAGRSEFRPRVQAPAVPMPEAGPVPALAMAHATATTTTHAETLAVARAAAIEEAGCGIRLSAALTQDAIGEAAEAGRLVQALRETSARIDNMVGMISDITGQTSRITLEAPAEIVPAGGPGWAFAGAATNDPAAQAGPDAEVPGAAVVRFPASVRAA